MMIEPSLRAGVGVPVFAVRADAPNAIVAWNDHMEAITGVPAARAVGRTMEQVLGAGAVSEGEFSSGRIEVAGIGAMTVRDEGDLVICYQSDRERSLAQGLAVQELRAPLRMIMAMAEEARGDLLAADAYLARIKQIARHGMATAGHVQTSDHAGTGVRTRLDPVVLDEVFTEVSGGSRFGRCAAVRATCKTVLVDREVLVAVVGRLMAHLGPTTVALWLDADAVEQGLQFSLSFQSEQEGTGVGPKGLDAHGLLALRRFVRSRGGAITGPDAVSTNGAVFRLTLPGALLYMDGARQAM